MAQEFMLYNSLTKRIDRFTPREAGRVGLYTCGPTVYHYAHIGNLRSYIMEDVLEKYLRYIGYDVKRVMNVTDVGHLSSDADTGEDKMLKGARREGKSVMEIADFYTKAFFDDCAKLRIKTPDVVERATGCISDYIALIETLFTKGFAYAAGGNVYFNTSKLARYYTLVSHNAEALEIGVRDGVDEDPNKRNRTDFVLWFTKSKFDDQELRWESPWGAGYPGWHIECSAISIKHLGEYVDIHCGGIDNIFPHHTNEIAQSEAALGHPWCHHWFHVQHLNSRDGKMSKSKGEFQTVSRLEQMGYTPLAYRFLCLQSHYRKPMAFDWDALDSASIAYIRLLDRISRLDSEGDADKAGMSAFREQFAGALGNDLNTAMAVTALYDLVKSDLSGKTKLELIREFDQVLSLGLIAGKTDTGSDVDETLASYVNARIEERNAAKGCRDFALADRIRNELFEKGIVIQDTREGSIWKRKQ